MMMTTSGSPDAVRDVHNDARVTAAVLPGGSHILAGGTEAQDYAQTVSKPGFVALALSDGHGSPEYHRSAHGARIAVTCALELLEQFMQPGAPSLSDPENLKRRLLWEWRRRVKLHDRTQRLIDGARLPKTEADTLPGLGDDEEDGTLDRARVRPYGATLLAAAVSNEFMVLLHIGDGQLRVFRQGPEAGEDAFPVAEKLGSATASLCMDSAMKHLNVRIERIQTPPRMLYLASDGVCDIDPEFGASALARHAEDWQRACLGLPTRLADLARIEGDDASVALALWPADPEYAQAVIPRSSPRSPGYVRSPRSLLHPAMLMIPPGPLSEVSPSGRQHKPDIAVARFLMAATPVTQAQYAAVMGVNPSHFRGDDDRPVERVSWLEAVEYCNRLSKEEGLTPAYRRVSAARGQQATTVARVFILPEANGYRLPTAAEWVYACRAGTTSAYWSGTGEHDLARVAWYEANSGGATHAVGEKPESPWGLYDMHGNVWEWCNNDCSRRVPRWRRLLKDRASSVKRQLSSSIILERVPHGPIDQGRHSVDHVLHGGGWNSSSSRLEALSAGKRAQSFRGADVGFRVVRALEAPEGTAKRVDPR